MLTAIRNDGSSVCLLPRRAKALLKKEREKGEFYCPECKERVIMKIGTKKMEHFAHVKGSVCTDSYERESEYHLNGKLQLYDWLVNQQFSPTLEPFFSEIRQRPDLSVPCVDRHFAIEFQCCKIPPELLEKRTKQYMKQNIIPVWILGGNNIKRKGKNKVSLSCFDYLFLRKSSSGIWYLPAYCPSSNIFILLTNILPITTKNALCNLSTYRPQTIPFQQLIAPNNNIGVHSIAISDWRQELQAQKSSLLLQGYYSNAFIKELYLRGVNLSLLPPMIGLPVPHGPIIETPPLVWQVYFFLDHIHRKKEGIITFNEVYRSFSIRVRKQQIKLRTLPLVSDGHPGKPLLEYLHLLVHLHVLEAVNDTTFKIKNEVKMPEHSLQQQKQEEFFYQQFAHILIN